jgi:hypothetical protein
MYIISLYVMEPITDTDNHSLPSHLGSVVNKGYVYPSNCDSHAPSKPRLCLRET